MKSRITIVIAAVMVGFVACVAWALGLFERRYGGVPASTYLHNIVSQDRFGGQEDKQKVLAVPSHVGVPILIRFTKAQDPRWRGWYQRFYPKLPQFIRRRLGPPKSNAAIVQKSIRALGYYGADAHPAVPQLLKLETDAATQKLQYSQFIQNSAIATLGEIGPPASNAIPMLIAHVQSQSAFPAYPAAVALGRIDSHGERSGALLLSVLDTYMQAVALEALGRMASTSQDGFEKSGA